MAKKKATKHNQWKGTRQIIVMGDELSMSEMQPASVYSVLKLSKGEGDLNYAWGIIITGKNAEIIRNYNINAEDCWDSNKCTLKHTWRVFPADNVSNDFAVTYLHVSEAVKELHEMRMEMQRVNRELAEVKYKSEHMSLWERIFGK